MTISRLAHVSLLNARGAEPVGDALRGYDARLQTAPTALIAWNRADALSRQTA
jgi:hypothetical protein